MLVVQTERQNYNISQFARCYRGIILEKAKEPDKYVRVGYYSFSLTRFEKKFGRGRLVEGIKIKEVTVI